jgi:uncharacterized membrane protein
MEMCSVFFVVRANWLQRINYGVRYSICWLYSTVILARLVTACFMQRNGEVVIHRSNNILRCVFLSPCYAQYFITFYLKCITGKYRLNLLSKIYVLK